MSFKGAGGTDGGMLHFIIGVAMLIGGGYMFLSSIMVTNVFSLSHGLYQAGSISISSGMILIPFMFGIGMLFYNSKNIFGWILTAGSLVAIVLGVIASTRFVFRAMSLFDMIVILILMIGGIGLILRSFRSQS
jgi:hypothetical protein